MVSRVAVPGKPVLLIPLGPGVGRTHNYTAEAKTVDDWKAWDRPARPIHNVRLERPR